MIDTHTHIYLKEDYDNDCASILRQGLEAGVSHFVLPNVDVASLQMVKDLHTQFPDETSMAIGLHPTEVKEDWAKALDMFEKELATGNYKAVGETGIDLYWDNTLLELQAKPFELQLKMAESASIPVIIHSRNAFKETVELIAKVSPTVPLIFHSFTGTSDDVKLIREVCNPYFGINGVVTFKNAKSLREALPEIGLDRIVLETDAPWLTPTPHRGKRNDSSYLGFIRDGIAQTLNITPQEVEEKTDATAKAIFKI